MAHHHDICKQCFEHINSCACEAAPQKSELDILTARKQQLEEETERINKRIRELVLQGLDG